jgi:phosphate transport system substrate-binding protein
MKKYLLLVLLPTLLLGGVSAGCGGDDTGQLSVSGSTTVQPLAEELAEAFMQKNPGIMVTVQGGGSTMGVKSTAEGITDIGTASRELFPAEAAAIKAHVFAYDGIAIVVHPENPVRELTTEQLRDIYAGTITNWSEVGGDDASISVMAREEGSGTRTSLEEKIMKPGGALITKNALLQPSNGAIRTAAAGDEHAIGFISFAYLNDSVRAVILDSVEPSLANAEDGLYPIIRPLLLLTKKTPSGMIKEFIDFCLSPEGQVIVAKDYISLGNR